MLKETYESDGFRPPWTYSIEEYLRVSAQRWYAPRINNPDYDGLSLTVWIGDSMIKPTEMLPLFRTVREMYIYQCLGELPPDSYSGPGRSDFRHIRYCCVFQIEHIAAEDDTAGQQHVAVYPDQQ